MTYFIELFWELLRFVKFELKTWKNAKEFFISTINIHILLYIAIYKSEMSEDIFVTFKAGNIFLYTGSNLRQHKVY